MYVTVVLHILLTHGCELSGWAHDNGKPMGVSSGNTQLSLGRLCPN